MIIMKTLMYEVGTDAIILGLLASLTSCFCSLSAGKLCATEFQKHMYLSVHLHRSRFEEEEQIPEVARAAVNALANG